MNLLMSTLATILWATSLLLVVRARDVTSSAGSGEKNLESQNLADPPITAMLDGLNLDEEELDTSRKVDDDDHAEEDDGAGEWIHDYDWDETQPNSMGPGNMNSRKKGRPSSCPSSCRRRHGYTCVRQHRTRCVKEKAHADKCIYDTQGKHNCVGESVYCTKEGECKPRIGASEGCEKFDVRDDLKNLDPCVKGYPCRSDTSLCQ